MWGRGEKGFILEWENFRSNPLYKKNNKSKQTTNKKKKKSIKPKLGLTWT